MAMIKCPECSESVSDTADSCPKCGFGVLSWVKKQATEAQRMERNAVAKEKKARSNKVLAIVLGVLLFSCVICTGVSKIITGIEEAKKADEIATIKNDEPMLVKQVESAKKSGDVSGGMKALKLLREGFPDRANEWDDQPD